jgi:hypothetical protein
VLTQFVEGGIRLSHRLILALEKLLYYMLGPYT